MTKKDERAREREFYTYYDAYRALSDLDPPFADLYDAEAAARHVPRLAPDPTLTAFCQLGALRMNTKRCMIFFFDQKNGYVLAESTQSHHSGNASDLWLGTATFSRGISVCEHTVNIPEANKGSNQHCRNAGEIHIINDLREDVRFCDRPYVQGAPNARFYAGVPITTSGGANIGAYCVLDDSPRHGVSDDEVDFIKHMGSLVMRHLEELRTSSEFGRGARLLQGLGVITRLGDDTTLSKDHSEERGAEPRMQDPKRSGSNRKQASVESHTPILSDYSSDRTGKKATKEPQTPYRPRMTRTTSLTFGVPTTTESATKDEAAPQMSTTRAESSSRHANGNEPAQSINKQIKNSFQRASSLLLDAVKSDGVVFLDATAAKMFDDAVTSRQFSGANSMSDRSTDESDNSAVPRDPATRDVLDTGPKCDVLGHSEVNGAEGSPSFENMITERFLRSLIKRYPNGKTWTFDASGQAHDFIDDLASSITSSGDTGTGKSSRAGAQRTLREAPKLQRLFSLGLRTLCFAPMWDPVRERWYAAALTWSKSLRHGLSRQNELSYLSAFCDVTMAEVLRMESRQEAKSRTALMSSVSHELRSPLHGILGSIDLLKGSSVLDWSLVEQIQKCSLNLVDVIDHLLDFAQINSKSPNPMPTPGGPPVKSKAKGHASKHATSLVSLARTTEEIVDAVYYAHHFTHRNRIRSHVDLVLELTPRSATECFVSVGAWKRLCTNIVNNALKYTIEGYVKVSLDVEHRDHDRPLATLIVADTGIGMSPEFLKQSLFQSFSQEDSLATGTGLGMSLVAQLIKQFGGEIVVTSLKGKGTTMTVTMPLDVKEASLEANFSPELDCSTYDVGFPDPKVKEVCATHNRSMLINAVKHTLSDLGATLVRPSEADVVALLEEDFQLQMKRGAQNEQRHLVLCESFASAAHMRERCHNTTWRAEFVPQPYGPERLSAAVRLLCKNSGRDDAGTGGIDQVSAQTKDDLGALPQTPGDEPLDAFLAEGETSATRPLPSPPLDIPLEHLTLSGRGEITATPSLYQTSLASRLDRGTTRPRSRDGEATIAGSQQSPNSPSAKAPADNAQGPSVSPRGPESLSLLLVDDNPINLKLLTMVADRNHYPRLLATNGKEAVEAYKSALQSNDPERRKPDVVLLDLNMPVMDGFEAARQIRQFEKQIGALPATIVAITGLGDDIAKARAYQSGFNLFMSKPVRPPDLTAMLESVTQARSNA